MKTDFTTGVERDAVISECGTYRYLLKREWDPSLPLFVFCLLNPSKADAMQDDPTAKKGMGFTRRLGGGRMWFVNLFAFRTTYPIELWRTNFPIVGPENDTTISEAFQAADKIILAWGGIRKQWESRTDQIVRDIMADFSGEKPAYCLGKTKDGQPRHPLMLTYDTPLEIYP